MMFRKHLFSEQLILFIQSLKKPQLGQSLK
jgi:hypothetical protein